MAAKLAPLVQSHSDGVIPSTSAEAVGFAAEKLHASAAAIVMYRSIPSLPCYVPRWQRRWADADP